jgi:lipopolysaccharide export system protein LptA
MEMMRAVRVGCMSILAALALPGQAAAEPILEVGPGNVTVQADKLEVDVAGGSAVLLGSVTLSKGDLLVKCPRVELRFDTAPHVKWLKGSGGVVADVRGVHAEAPEVELDMSKQILELRGGVKLSRGQGWLEANRATIDLQTAKVTAHQVKGSLPVPKAP